MPILNIKTSEVGLVGIKPNFVYIDTNDTLAQVTATGYLNGAVQRGADFAEWNMALVTTKTTPNATSTEVALLEIAHVGGDWSLIPSNSTESLTSGNIFVGNASNIAADVTMSGDATIDNTGALTIANDAITTAKILDDAVTSAKIDPLVIQYTSVTMSAAEFNGAYAAPHLLLAAQGADTLIVLEAAQVLMTYGTTQFANGGVAHIQYDDTANGAGIIASSTQAAANFFDAADTALGFNMGIVKQPFATAVNLGLYFSNITAAFDTGDSDFVVHVWYRVIPSA